MGDIYFKTTRSTEYVRHKDSTVWCFLIFKHNIYFNHIQLRYH